MGLSYHYSMWCKIEEGLLYFILFRSAQVAQAFEEAKKILVHLLSCMSTIGTHNSVLGSLQVSYKKYFLNLLIHNWPTYIGYLF